MATTGQSQNEEGERAAHANEQGESPYVHGEDSPVLAAALNYTARGWRVIPVNGKRPLTPHGYQDGATEESVIRAWWTTWPAAGVAIVVGPESGLSVVDIDPRNGGSATLEALRAQHGLLPETLTVRTGGDGLHLYFRYHPRAGRRLLGPGVEMKGAGGYVVAPPSPHPSGGTYKWSGPEDALLAELPEWMLDDRSTASAGAQPLPKRIPEGERHRALTSLAGSMRRRDAPPHAIQAALAIVNLERCEPPLSDPEVAGITSSVALYPAPPPTEPRGGLEVAVPPGQTHSAATIGTSSGRENLRFRTAKEVASMTGGEVSWIAEPWVARGSITELAGKVKQAGKTTLLAHLVAAVLDGCEFLGRPTTRTPVFWLTEQNPTSFRQVLRRAGLLNRDDLHVLFWHETLGIPWEEVVRAVLAEAQRQGAGLLAVDTLGQFAGLKGDTENSSGDALAAIQPLQAAAAAGLGILVNRHERKGGGEVGESGRGSSAFSGAVDVVLVLRRPEGQPRPTIRQIVALSRFDETPPELLIELRADGYVALGTAKDIAHREARQAILREAPTDQADALTIDELLERISGMKRTVAQKALAELVQDSLLRRIGAGVKGDGYRYLRVAMDTGTDSGRQDSFCRNSITEEG